jgi:hypothetical protein
MSTHPATAAAQFVQLLIYSEGRLQGSRHFRRLLDGSILYTIRSGDLRLTRNDRRHRTTAYWDVASRIDGLANVLIAKQD